MAGLAAHALLSQGSRVGAQGWHLRQRGMTGQAALILRGIDSQ